MVQYRRGLTSNRRLTFECGKEPRDRSEGCVRGNGWSCRGLECTGYTKPCSHACFMYITGSLRFDPRLDGYRSSRKDRVSSCLRTADTERLRSGNLSRYLIYRSQKDTTVFVSQIHGPRRPQGTPSHNVLGVDPSPLHIQQQGQSMATRNEPLSGPL